MDRQRTVNGVKRVHEGGAENNKTTRRKDVSVKAALTSSQTGQDTYVVPLMGVTSKKGISGEPHRKMGSTSKAEITAVSGKAVGAKKKTRPTRPFAGGGKHGSNYSRLRRNYGRKGRRATCGWKRPCRKSWRVKGRRPSNPDLLRRPTGATWTAGATYPDI